LLGVNTIRRENQGELTKENFNPQTPPTPLM